VRFSSSSVDRDEPTHINTRPTAQWAAWFAERRFFPPHRRRPVLPSALGHAFPVRGAHPPHADAPPRVAVRLGHYRAHGEAASAPQVAPSDQHPQDQLESGVSGTVAR
jgi:hypothetical protein